VSLPALVEPDEPQAEIASAQPTAANAIGSLRLWRASALVSLALRNLDGFPRARWIGQCRGYTSGRITHLSRRYAVVNAWCVFACGGMAGDQDPHSRRRVQAVG
jgi:hypothetical protein